MSEAVRRAIVRKREQEDRQGRQYPLMDLPTPEGKLLEPLVGRMRPVTSEIPASVDVAKLREKGRPMPDPTRKNLRSRPNDVYERTPVMDPMRANTLAVIHEQSPSVRIGLRTDLAKELRDRHETEPYIAEVGHGGVDPYTRAPYSKWTYEFVNGQVREIPSEQAVYLLRHSLHGQWLEEKGAAAEKPKRRGRPRKQAVA